jgi:xanthine dehydrogenase accessory factor
MWHYELNEKDADPPGMICGGVAELLLDCVAPTARNIDFFRCWYEAIQQGNSFYSVTHLKDADDSVAVLGHSILYPDGRVMGHTLMTRTDIERLRTELRNISTTSIIPLGDTRVVIERIHKLKTLYCFGGGHVAVPTAHIAALVGFRVVVVDDRPEFASTGRFPDADQIRLIDDFSWALEGLEIDPDSYIVIVTRGHQYDRVVLEQALKTDAGYIGMISSRRKREAIFDALMAGGVKKEELERVHSPIGIAIGGETPEEIAVSIVAELIRERSQQPS